LLACAFALLTAERVAAAPVNWDFIATSCSLVADIPSDCNPAQQYPLVLATLSLTGPDSSGEASIGLFPTSGDPFAFDLVAAQGLGTGISMFSTADPTGPLVGFPPTPWVVDYAIAWTEVAGVLTSVSVSLDTIQDSLIGFGLTGGLVASDFNLAGCDFATCQLNGFWTDVSLVTAPEPGSLALLASAFGVWGVIGRRRVQRRVCSLWQARAKARSASGSRGRSVEASDTVRLY
jgi:hypothetical protein